MDNKPEKILPTATEEVHHLYYAVLTKDFYKSTQRYLFDKLKENLYFHNYYMPLEKEK